ncbi:2OG-Fe(II) oxygenase [Kangiella sp. TOML190]|uniref:prolyl hydroxylase family protein n=1 Tax=Kangiella sp. TOML190 TaxID=2931351 RepID=UPI0020419921|nr:2OG-Fe(II) oxygenase [Kangiella sp. TOML190]
MDADKSQEFSQTSLLSDEGIYRGNLMAPSMQSVCSDQEPGLTVVKGTLPPGVLMIQPFLSDAFCDELISKINAEQKFKATIQDVKDVERNIESKTRNNEISSLGSLSDDLETLVNNFFKDEFINYYKKNISSFEKPQALIYSKGGFYDYHADSENWDKHQKQWVKSANRDYSLLIYLNDDFDGGELTFPNFQMRLKPRKGMLLCFPSDHRYLHKAELTTQGHRYVIVSWARAKGTELIENAPLYDSIQVK